jgi:hypothetical protein
MRKKFKVLIHGSNYLIQVDETTRKHGFYTTVFVEARNSEEAESAAIELLRKDSKLLNMVINSESDPPRHSVESTDEIASFENCTIPRAGLILYAEESKASKP